jgi:hypothetical protein
MYWKGLKRKMAKSIPRKERAPCSAAVVRRGLFQEIVSWIAGTFPGRSPGCTGDFSRWV